MVQQCHCIVFDKYKFNILAFRFIYILQRIQTTLDMGCTFCLPIYTEHVTQKMYSLKNPFVKSIDLTYFKCYSIMMLLFTSDLYATPIP